MYPPIPSLDPPCLRRATAGTEPESPDQRDELSAERDDAEHAADPDTAP
jgi:hypothetical protein